MEKLITLVVITISLAQKETVGLPSNLTEGNIAGHQNVAITSEGQVYDLSTYSLRTGRQMRNGQGPIINCYNCNIYVGGSSGNRPSPNGDRVLGGRPARQGEFPHIVSIQNRNGGKFCGGTILDGSWVLTAAHCLPGESADNLKVVGGVVDLRTFPPERQDINVQSFCMHKDYRDTSTGYDIALLRLEQPFQPSRYVRSGRIRYQAFSNLEGTPGVIAGWGRVGGARTSEMYTATVDYYNMAECRKNYQENQPPGTALCAGSGPYGGKDVCPGDSGGPISCTDGQTKYDTCGLVSYGTSCTEEQDQFRGGVYTNVASFSRWINDAKYATADDNPNLCRFS